MIVFRFHFLSFFSKFLAPRSVFTCTTIRFTKSNKLLEKWVLPRGKSMGFLLNQMLKPLPFSFIRNILLNLFSIQFFYAIPKCQTSRIVYVVPSKHGNYPSIETVRQVNLRVIKRKCSLFLLRTKKTRE